MLKEKIEKIRKSKGWSKKEAAQRCGLSYDTFISISLGRNQKIYPETIKSLARGFDVSPAYFIEDVIPGSFIQTVRDRVREMSEPELIELIEALGFPRKAMHCILILRKKAFTLDELNVVERMLQMTPGSKNTTKE